MSDIVKDVLRGEVVSGEIPGLDCRLCGKLTQKTDRDTCQVCSGCGCSFEFMDGKWKLKNEDGWPDIQPTGYRHRITRTVRSELYDYYKGKKIPEARLKFLIGLLLDHHCALEGMCQPPRDIRPQPKPRPIPPFPKPKRLPDRNR